MGKSSSINTHPFLAPQKGWKTSAKAPCSIQPGCKNFSLPRALLFLAAIHYVKRLDIYNYAQSGHFENLYVSRLPVHHNVKPVNGGIHQKPHITDLGAVINTREMLAEPCVPLLSSGQEAWSMGTPPGGMPLGAHESLIIDEDGSRVGVPLARAFPADSCHPQGRGGFPPGGTIQAITCFHPMVPLSAERQLPHLGMWESPGVMVSYRDRIHDSNTSSTLGH